LLQIRRFDTFGRVCSARFWMAMSMKEDLYIEQIKASLGSLLLLWSRIERAARDEVALFYEGHLPKSAHGIAAVLNAWEATVTCRTDALPLSVLLASTLRAQLQDQLNIRNGVCHGVVGFSVAHGDRPATLTWELNGERRSITLDELQATFSWLSKVPSAFSIISHSRSEGLGSRMTDNSENRDWWKAEYGLSPS